MKGKVSALAVSAMLSAGVALAAKDGQMTVINQRSSVKFERCSLMANRFDWAAKTKLSYAEELKMCESLDFSKFCYFGSLFDREHTIGMYDAFFSSKSICNSLSAFLKRGGMVFFAPVTWTQLNTWPESMKRFFADNGVKIPGSANYENNIPGSDKEKQLTASVVPTWKGSLFDSPRPVEGQLRSIRHFKDIDRIGYEPVAVTPEGYPVVIATKVGGKGLVVFSHLYPVERQVESPFYWNLIEGLYGKDAVRRRSSRNAYIAEARNRGKDRLYVCAEPVYSKTFADTPVPDDAEDVGHIDLLLARGDRELAKIVFYNCSDDNLVFRLEPEANLANRDIFAFQEVMTWGNVAGLSVNEIVREPTDDGLVSVPSGETKVLLLAAETRRRPGKYDWSFELVPVNVVMPTRKITVTAEVLDLEIDPSLFPTTYLWGPYDYSFALGRADAYRAFAMDRKHITYSMAGTRGDHWTRMLFKNAAGRIECVKTAPKDLCADEIGQKRAGHRFVNGYGHLDRFCTRMKALGVKEPDLRQSDQMALFEQGIRLIDAEFRKAGITPDDFYEPLMDEPNLKHIHNVLAAGKFVRSLGWKVNTGVASWCTMDDIRALTPITDWWQPAERRITERASGKEENDYYRSTGVRYTPGQSSTSGSDDPYLHYHRYRGLRAILNGWDGWCTWAMNSWRGNDYRGRENNIVFDASKMQFPGVFYVHHGDRGPVGTMRLEAFREGIEDYHWLKYAAKTGKGGIYASEECLKRLNASEDASAVQKWRNALLRELAK